MGFRTGAYAKVWEVAEGEYGKTARITISKKDKATDKYKQEFSNWVNIGNNIEITEGDRIRIGDCEVRNTYNKETKITKYRFYIWSLYEDEETEAQEEAPVEESLADEEDPF